MKNPELWDEMLSQIKRYKTEYAFIPDSPPHNVPPAFIEWKNKCLSGNKLPQGKYFRRQESLRCWLNSMNTANYTPITVHAG